MLSRGPDFKKRLLSCWVTQRPERFMLSVGRMSPPLCSAIILTRDAESSCYLADVTAHAYMCL